LESYTIAYLAEKSEEHGAFDEIYFNFIRSYNKDMKIFVLTGKYPLQTDANRSALGRFEYDIVLLFSCLFSEHRFRIMQLINEQSSIVNCGLFIGCGPGLEIELVKSSIQKLYAYDLSINDFLLTKHPTVQFKEAYFTGEDDNLRYDSIYLIELLEHLSEPYVLLRQCQNVLSENGKIFLTTATNIPQFDHLYNFEASNQDFEEKIKKMGLSISFMEDIPHQFITLDIGAKNRFYILKKDRNC
jgi:SAM-dependent methyltransferase